MNNREKEKRETPITDGDARPDMPLDPENEKGKKRSEVNPKRKFGAERISDQNSLDDFRDAKEE